MLLRESLANRLPFIRLSPHEAALRFKEVGDPWCALCSPCVCLTPILSEWRCERPLMVCSSRLMGFRSGKRDGSSTYCRRGEGQRGASIGFFYEKTSTTKLNAGDKHAANDLLQGGGAQLDGDVSEEAVPLRAEISDDVGVRVRLSEQLHLPLGHLETLGQDPLDGDAAPVEFPPEVEKAQSFQSGRFHTVRRSDTLTRVSLWVKAVCFLLTSLRLRLQEIRIAVQLFLTFGFHLQELHVCSVKRLCIQFSVG